MSFLTEAVQDAGYGASVKGVQKSSAAEEDALAGHDTPVLKRRLFASLGFLLVLMYFSMGHMMWGWPLPAPIAASMEWQGVIQAVLTLAIMIVNRKFFVSGVRGVLHGAPNMDTLVALGAGASFLYSLTALFAMAWEMGKGNGAAVQDLLMNHIWFETAAMIPCLITFGKTLESYSKGRTTDALKSLMKLAPKTAVVEKGGLETEIPIAELKPGDIVRAK